MRFRPANISLINRRHYLPRLLLTLSLKDKNKSHPTDLQLLTGSHHITSASATIRPEPRNSARILGHHSLFKEFRHYVDLYAGH